MISVNKENFEAEVLQSPMPCVVDLWGPQCGPCLALMPEVEKLAGEFEGRVRFCENVARLTGEGVSIEAIREEAGKLL